MNYKDDEVMKLWRWIIITNSLTKRKIVHKIKKKFIYKDYDYEDEHNELTDKNFY